MQLINSIGGQLAKHTLQEMQAQGCICKGRAGYVFLPCLCYECCIAPEKASQSTTS